MPSCRAWGDTTDIIIDATTEGAPPPFPGVSHANAIHLLRTMQQHHVTLSAMADQKASIIIGVNSVVFALVVKEAATNPALLVLAASSGLAAVLCMLAVLPKLGGGKGPAAPPNLLFFRGFTQMSEADWIGWLDRTNADDHAIQVAMARDVYQLGQVLAQKKYKYLGWGYRVIIGGLIATFVVFLLQTALGL
ncbi:Pycsar system effector family protein [Sandarakinorhabdus limnophila]|uniref:Pycsar system effector family protein n=1 Tax=Sandarakinorhabdus limnophila TaxID=210512 RepID=UPI0004004589|nr:Pycsar system effector family protein [Sandarakinorhabdus limnophila]